MTLIFTVIVFTICRKTYSHRCQCKQMHRNYFQITTALCHLTAVLFSLVYRYKIRCTLLKA